MFKNTILRALIIVSYFVSLCFTILFMVQVSQNQSKFEIMIYILMGFILEAGKIHFTYQWALNPESKFIGSLSLILIFASIFFSYVFTANTALNNREEGKTITAEYKQQEQTIKDSEKELTRLIGVLDKLEAQKEEDLKGVPKNWTTERRGIREEYNPKIKIASNDVEAQKEIIKDNKNKLTNINQYQYITVKGFNPSAIKQAPLLNKLIENIPDVTLVQAICILIGLLIEIIGVACTFMEGKKIRLEKDIKSNEEKQIKDMIKDLQIQVASTKQVSDQQIQVENTYKQVNKQDTSTYKQEQAYKKLELVNFENTGLQASDQVAEKTFKNSSTANTLSTTVMLEDYEFMKKVLDYLKDFAGKDFNKQALITEFNLTNTQYRRIMEKLKENNIVSSTGNKYKVNKIS